MAQSCAAGENVSFGLVPGLAGVVGTDSRLVSRDGLGKGLAGPDHGETRGVEMKPARLRHFQHRAKLGYLQLPESEQAEPGHAWVVTLLFVWVGQVVLVNLDLEHAASAGVDELRFAGGQPNYKVALGSERFVVASACRPGKGE